jgi:hypothetical protein
VDALGLKKGDVATVVDNVPSPDGGEEGCPLEVFNAVGELVQIAAVPVPAVDQLTPNNFPSIRRRSAV